METLKLNADYTPLEIVNWQSAIGLWWVDKADIVESYEDFTLTSSYLEMPCPSVIRLREYKKSSRKKVNCTQTNVFIRDDFTCQYCGKEKKRTELNLDHVIPKAQGGIKEWTNLVTSCFPCNTKKRNRTPEQASMPLIRKPVKPRYNSAAVFIKSGGRHYPSAWGNYLV